MEKSNKDEIDNNNSASSSDAEDNNEEFLDAYDCDISETQGMDLEKAMEQSQLAIDYFFNNKFLEAREIVKMWANSSMYHSTGECVFAFLSATLTFDRELINDANVKIKSCISLCNTQRKKRSFGESIGTIVKKTNYDSYTDVEAHAELCYAEVLLLKAILTFIEDEELLSLVKGSLKIKQCYNSYKECATILKDRNWTDENSKNHFESGVRMGIGSFNLMISLLPGRIIRLLEFVGFSGDKAQGISELLKGLNGDGIRQVLCVMTLLGYHLIVCYVITDQPGDLNLCDDIITKQLKIYPSGVWFLFFKGRLEYMKGNLDDAVSWYKKSWRSQDIWPQFHHLCFWELLWVHCMSLEWREALLYCDYLLESSRWSRTIYSYQKAAVMCMAWEQLSSTEKKTCDSLINEAPSFKQRIAGKSLPMEKFVIKRCKKYIEQGKGLILPAIEMMYLWNMFRVFSKNFSVGDKILKLIESTEASGVTEPDDKALLLLLKGSAFRHLGAHLQAQKCLDSVISLKKQIKEDTFLIPYAIVEIGLLFNNMGDKLKAIGALEDARKNYSGYSLESRLHFRIHTALTHLKG